MSHKMLRPFIVKVSVYVYVCVCLCECVFVYVCIFIVHKYRQCLWGKYPITDPLLIPTPYRISVTIRDIKKIYTYMNC